MSDEEIDLSDCPEVTPEIIDDILTHFIKWKNESTYESYPSLKNAFDLLRSDDIEIATFNRRNHNSTAAIHTLIVVAKIKFGHL